MTEKKDDAKTSVEERLKAAEFDMRQKVLDARGQPMPFQEQRTKRDAKGEVTVDVVWAEATLGLLIHHVLTNRTNPQNGVPERVVTEDAMRFDYIAHKCAVAQYDEASTGKVRLSTDQIELILLRADLSNLPIQALGFMKRILNPAAFARIVTANE